MNVLTKWLDSFFERTDPIDFYRDIFRYDLQEKGEEHYCDGRYNAIAVEIGKDDKGEKKVFRHTITNDLEGISDMCSRKNFCLMSPISYIGKRRKSENARVLYAIAVDLDGIIIEDGFAKGLHEMFFQIEKVGRIPKPTYIVSSGTGIHLYYVLEDPILLYPNMVEQLQKYKHELTEYLWHGFITTLESNVQQESLFQGFRVPGTITKKGERAIAFRIDEGEKVTMEYMNSFVAEEFRVNEIAKKSSISLQEAKKKYPEWYDKRIVQKRPRGTWQCHRGLYDWWLNKIKTEKKVGHRYYCMMCLSIYARKSGIEYEELERDALSLLDIMDEISDDRNNRFTEGDILDSLQAYDDRYMTFPINSISHLTDIRIDKNKRNGRKREQHLILARGIKAMKKSIGEEIKEGRPKGAGTKKEQVIEWRKNNPDGTKAECHRQTKLDPKTIRKWWNWTEDTEEKEPSESAIAFEEHVKNGMPYNQEMYERYAKYEREKYEMNLMEKRKKIMENKKE